MKLIVGLGNPGTKYSKTRHNIGFMAVDALAKEMGMDFTVGRKYNVLFAKSNQLEILKPQTFMNNSGTAVQAIVRKHGISPENILVVMDDLDMETGKLRYRNEGSSGGHRGMQSIIDNLKTDQIKRLKIGIGRSENITPDEYVLGKFTAEQLKQIKTAIPAALETIKNKFLA